MKLNGGKSTEVRKRRRTRLVRSGLARRSRLSKSKGKEGAACCAAAERGSQNAARNSQRLQNTLGLRDASLNRTIMICPGDCTANSTTVYQSHAYRGICVGRDQHP